MPVTGHSAPQVGRNTAPTQSQFCSGQCTLVLSNTGSVDVPMHSKRFLCAERPSIALYFKLEFLLNLIILQTQMVRGGRVQWLPEPACEPTSVRGASFSDGNSLSICDRLQVVQHLIFCSALFYLHSGKPHCIPLLRRSATSIPRSIRDIEASHRDKRCHH